MLTVDLSVGYVLPVAVLLALWLDNWLGEPPARWHPVVWMGHGLQALGQRLSWRVGHKRSLAEGTLAWCALAVLVVASSWALQCGVHSAIHWGLSPQTGLAAGVAQAVLLGLLLKPMLALRMLCDEVRAVEAALDESLPAGRERLRWLVSRDVAQLSEGEVRESAIETLAENLNDSVVAPLFWFAVAGLPGAALYRFANTADAMWGYLGERGGRDWTWAGKWAARADDVLSWLPARLTAVLLMCVALPQPWGRWRHLPREARRTPSPNSGWPMAAMALALDVRLGKPGAYTLHAQAPVPGSTQFWQGIKYAQNVALSFVVIHLLAILFFLLVVS